MNRRPYLWLLASGLLAVAAVLVSGCQYPPAPANITTVVGDSLTMTALFEGGFPADYDVHSMLGWQAENAQPGLTDRVDDPTRSPARVAVALGANDSCLDAAACPTPRDGWTTTDITQMTQLANTPHPDACVVWVKSAYFGTDPGYIAGLAAHSQWLDGFAASRGERVFEWVDVARPEHIDADGLHLTHAGKLAYGALVQQAVASCG